MCHQTCLRHPMQPRTQCAQRRHKCGCGHGQPCSPPREQESALPLTDASYTSHSNDLRWLGRGKGKRLPFSRKRDRGRMGRRSYLPTTNIGLVDSGQVRPGISKRDVRIVSLQPRMTTPPPPHPPTAHRVPRPIRLNIKHVRVWCCCWWWRWWRCVWVGVGGGGGLTKS